MGKCCGLHIFTVSEPICMLRCIIEHAICATSKSKTSVHTAVHMIYVWRFLCLTTETISLIGCDISVFRWLVPITFMSIAIRAVNNTTMRNCPTIWMALPFRTAATDKKLIIFPGILIAHSKWMRKQSAYLRLRRVSRYLRIDLVAKILSSDARACPSLVVFVVQSTSELSYVAFRSFVWPFRRFSGNTAVAVWFFQSEFGWIDFWGMDLRCHVVKWLYIAHITRKHISISWARSWIS
jgi:hypothetical protein